MTTVVVKPKERQFQVVPVPAVFTRGRWECIDYKDGAAPGGPGAPQFSIGGDQTIEFDKSINASATPTPLATQIGTAGNGQQQQPTAGAAAVGGETTPGVQQTPQPGCGGAAFPTNSSVPRFEISPSHSVPTTLGTEFVPPGISSGDSSLVTNSSTTSNAPINAPAPAATCGGANSVAIDNKIEQAMDLVKTHLTFAVREEVEILRSTITDLESRVNLLENENQILRQFAPSDVVTNLPTLVHAAVAQQQKAAAVAQSNQQMKTFQSIPSAPIIMDTSSMLAMAQQPTPKIQQSSPPSIHPQHHSPTPGAVAGDEIL